MQVPDPQNNSQVSGNFFVGLANLGSSTISSIDMISHDSQYQIGGYGAAEAPDCLQFLLIVTSEPGFLSLFDGTPINSTSTAVFRVTASDGRFVDVSLSIVIGQIEGP
jgi:hypothetical protein